MKLPVLIVAFEALCQQFRLQRSKIFGVSSNAVLFGEGVLRVEPNDQNNALSIESIAQQYVFVNGVGGVLAKWSRPEAKRSIGHLAQKRDERGSFCK